MRPLHSVQEVLIVCLQPAAAAAAAIHALTATVYTHVRNACSSRFWKLS